MRRNALLLAILSALSGCAGSRDGKACMEVPATQTTCPSKGEVDRSRLSVEYGSCGDAVTAVTGDGERVERPRSVQIPGSPTDPIPSCCYPVEITHYNAACPTP